MPPCSTPRTDRVAALAVLVLLALAACTAPTPAPAPAGNAIDWQRQGHELRRQEAFDDAITAYENALALDPNNIEANAGMGAALLATGQAEAAIAPLQRAAELAPAHFWSHRLLGSAYLSLQRYPLAAGELTQAYVLRPDDLQVLIGIALAQGRSGRPELALRTIAQLRARAADPGLLADAEALQREFAANE
jgi:tetratricopeptide (TPR) repeat protein